MPPNPMMRDLGLFVREQAVAGDRAATELLTAFHRRRVAGDHPICDRCGAGLHADADFAVYGDGLVLCVRCQANVPAESDASRLRRAAETARRIAVRLADLERAGVPISG